MSESQYFVQLLSAPDDPKARARVAQQLAQRLGADSAKVLKLLSKAPRKISSTMSEAGASEMAQLCRGLGLEVEMVAVEPKVQRVAPALSSATSQMTTAGATAGAMGGTTSGAATRSQDRSSSRTGGRTTPSDGTFSTPYGPWVDILYKPRRTIRMLLDHSSNLTDIQIVIYLSALTSLNAGFPAALFVFVFVFPTNLIGIFIAGIIMSFVGEKAFGGRGDWRDTRMALAWGQVPGMWVGGALFVLNVVSVIFSFIGLRFVSSLVGILLVPAALVAVVWIAVIQIKALAEAHQFSSWKALGTWLVVAVLYGFLAFLASLAIGSFIRQLLA